MSTPPQRDGMTRRKLLQAAALTIPLTALLKDAVGEESARRTLDEYTHAQVRVTGSTQMAQRTNVVSVLMALDEDSLLFPYRQMAGQDTPGVSLSGWYEYLPTYDHHHDTAGLAPGHALGQWISALSRFYAASSFAPDEAQSELKNRVQRLVTMLALALTADFFAKTRFSAYTLDKLICGLLDAWRYAGVGTALAVIDQAIAAAKPSLPGRAIEREVQWKLGYDISWMWDENYTLPENLYRASEIAVKTGQGSAPIYRQMADAYLLDQTFFEPLARNENALADVHAYSHVNALCSAAQCFLTTGSRMHLDAARNGFALLEAQSYATAGWGPDETLRKPGTDELYHSLANTHNSFETPCGAYAHMKLTRYLLRATGDGRYGDSMERIFFNTILGALPLEASGRSYYHSDYSFNARRVYSNPLWPCCSGTLPQAIADYGINSYLRAAGEVWINLYQPSELRATIAGELIRITQTTDYPFDSQVHIALQLSRPTAFTLRLRIPSWADRPTLTINGTPQPVSPRLGFTAVSRTWRPNDTVLLTLPLTLRLEPLPTNGGPAHQNLVALLYGPTVLFALHGAESVAIVPPATKPYAPLQALQPAPIILPREALLAARRTSPREWTVATSTRTVRFLPFVALADHSYTTYVSTG